MIAMFQQLMRFLVERLDPAIDLPGSTLLLITTSNSIAYFEAMGAHGGRFEPRIIDGIFDSFWRGIKPAGETETFFLQRV